MVQMAMATDQPRTTGAFAAVSNYDALKNREDDTDTCRHVDRVDSEPALQGAKLQREFLRRLLNAEREVTQVTLCVDPRNNDAIRAYKK